MTIQIKPPTGSAADATTAQLLAIKQALSIDQLSNANAPLDSLSTPSAARPATVDAVVGGLSQRVDSTTFDTAVEDLLTLLQAKERLLTFDGATKDAFGNVKINPAKVSGRVIDGYSMYAVPGQASLQTFGPQTAALVSYPTSGGYSVTGPNNPTTEWSARGKGRYIGTTGAVNKAGFEWKPAVRFPETSTSPYGGFKSVLVVSPSDALTGRCFYGMAANQPAVNVALTAGTGAKWCIGADPADAELGIYNGNTRVSTITGFGANGNQTAPYTIEVEARPFPDYSIVWKITNELTKVVAQGKETTGIPAGGFDPWFVAIRDSGGATTSATLVTGGWAVGAWVNFAVGDSEALGPVPVDITGNTTLTRIQHANRQLYVNSASAVTLTVAGTGWTKGDALFGTNRGAGAITILGDGFTINKHADTPATVQQYQGFGLDVFGDGVVTRTA